MLITIYIIRYILCTLAMGTFVARCNVFPCMNKRTGFLLGAASTPFCIAAVIYIVCLIAPGVSSKLLIGLPVLISALYLITGKSRQVLKSLAKAAVSRTKIIGRAAVQHKVCVLVPVIAAMVFGMIIILADRNYTAYALLKAIGVKKYAVYVTIAFALAALFICILAYFMQKSRHSRFHLNERILVKIALGTGFLLIIMITAVKVYYSSQTLMGASDPSHYYAQAKYFAESRDAGEIDHYTGEKEGTVFRDDHGYLWPVWLGEARFFVSGQDDSLNPFIDKIAVCMVFFSFLLALYAIVWEITGSGLLAGFSVSLINLYRYTEYQILEGSRDAFRFLGMLLLLAVCINGLMMVQSRRHEIKAEKKKFQKQDAVDALFVGLFSYFCIEGHEGNVYLMFGLFIIYGIVLLCYKVSFLKLCLLGLSAGGGTVLGITKTIGFIASGSLFSSTAAVFHGTKVIDALKETSDSRGAWGAIVETYYIPELLLILSGILSVLYLIVKGVKHRKERENMKTISIAACLFGMLLPMLGVFDFFGYAFSKWTIEQSRYRMYFMVLFSIAVCYAGYLLWKKTASAAVRYSMLFFVMLAAGLAPLSQGSKGPVSALAVESHNNAVRVYAAVGNAAREKAGGKEVYVGDQILAYYCDCNAKLLYHPIAKPLIQAKSDDEIRKALEELKIGIIVLDIDNMYHDYSLLPLWEYINNPQYTDAFMAQTETGKKWVLYQMKE